jgi:small GTP-binding protein
LENKVKPEAGEAARDCCHSAKFLLSHAPENTLRIASAGGRVMWAVGAESRKCAEKNILPPVGRAGMGLFKKKICLLGAFAVGKTSLTERFVYGRFEEKYLTTVGVKISQKMVPPVQAPSGGRTVQHAFLIWDIAGLEKFDHVADNYFRGAAGALAVADMTRPETIEDLKHFGTRFRSVNPEAKLVLIGNKVDLFDDDRCTLARLGRLAREYATGFILTSAKSAALVEEAFLELSRKIEGFS